MNFQTDAILPPLRVLVVNPLTPTGQMIIIKILSGYVFGEKQFVDLILLVYFNEKPAGERLKQELIACAYSCYNNIIVSSDLPSISDADVFCFISNFYNPNKVDLNRIGTDDQFDALYLLIKIANHFSGPTINKKESIDDKVQLQKTSMEPQTAIRKPILMADGLVALDILYNLSKNMSPDIFFCPTPLADIAKNILADYLKVQCNFINHVLVWAANDEICHVEVEQPLIIHDQVENESRCNWDAIGKDLLHSSDLDHTQFSPSWMKKEFIEKITTTASKNPYGCIFRASLFAKALKCIWISRTIGIGEKFFCNMGVISDGSLGTTKGHPFILPLSFTGECWRVNKCYEDTLHLKSELKRINKAVREHHQTLIPYCRRFLRENVINQAFVPVPPESSSAYSLTNSSKTIV